MVANQRANQRPARDQELRAWVAGALVGCILSYLTPMTPDQMQTVALAHASRLVNHGPTVLVTSAHGQRRNVMAAAWSMPVEFTPPRIAVVIDKSTFTRELVLASGHFGLCVPSAAQAALTTAVGHSSGREPAAAGSDEFVRHGVAWQPGGVLGLPMVQGCLAWLELRRLPEVHSETTYDTFFGEVVWAMADERAFAKGRWQLDATDPHRQTIHHLGGGHYGCVGTVVQTQA
jgi:flavin reductase (DIM6/NTAB) family NADH-FMN oxidoreductase RutF